MKKPRVLMLTTQLGYGGAETSFIRLANVLARSMEVRVALFTQNYGKAGYAEGHLPLDPPVTLLDPSEPLPRLKRWLHRLAALRKLKAESDVTISFLSGPNMLNVLAGYSARSIVSLRGSRRFDPVAPVWQRRFFQYVIDPLIYLLAGRIVPVSEGLVAEIAPAARGKAVVIPPFFLPEEWKTKMAEPVPERFAPLQGQKVIVAAGRCSAEKGFQHLIPVVAELARRLPGVKLLLVGDGPLLPQLKDIARHAGLALDDLSPGVSSVIFAGYQANTLPLLRLGSVYAMTSATEGLPNVVLEAMFAGVPVIAANTPWGARSILDPGNAAQHTPFPTHTATTTAYGVLLPRIDRQLYEEEWVQTLYALLTKPVGFAGTAHARVQEFSLAVVGPKWEKLIHATSQRN